MEIDENSKKELPQAKNNAEAEFSTADASDNQYFFEDEIFEIDQKGRIKFGMVVETCDTYEDELFSLVNKGEVRVAWYPHGKELVSSERDIGLVDRTLMPGDVVRRLVPGRDTQRGYVREMKVRADVRLLNSKYVIRDVKTERLMNVLNTSNEAVVCLDSWVGGVRVTEERVTMRTNYGARIEVPSQVLWAFEDYDARSLHGIYEPVIMFTGNRLVGRLPSVDSVTLLTPDIPLRTNRRGRPLTEQYIVESVNTVSAWVNWQCKALSNEKDALQQPDSIVTGEDLKRLQYLNLFEACMLQISDRNFLTIEDNDMFITKADWEKEQVEKYKVIYEQQQTAEYQSLYVNASGTTTGSISSSHHTHDKPKKKLNTLENEKTGIKVKMHALNAAANATGSVSSKDREKIVKSTNFTKLMQKSANDVTDNSSWVTEEEDDEDDDTEADIFVEDYEDGGSDASTLNYEKDSDASSIGGGWGTGSVVSDVSGSALKYVSMRVPSRLAPSQQHNVARRNFIKRSLKKLRKSSSYSTPRYKLENVSIGDKVATEALLVYSKATVVWQDGSVEEDIESTDLYPIHHLDNHEFFPGDFVISGVADKDVSYRDYGVIQTVDHLGRTALVKWFTTYTTAEEAKPTYKGTSEVSVYDLKDHPDFQYRPGVMVIRVANFEGEESKCTAGQIIDNTPTGLVKVWWVDGHTSMCWPQDLFEVGRHVRDWDDESEDSWETASTHSDSSQKLAVEHSHILSNIERARVAIERLAEIFHLSPNLQSIEVMRKLLSVYKCCRYLDRLLNTNFFHEENFGGLIERVRKCQTIAERAQDRKMRLFNESQNSPSKHSQLTNIGHSKTSINLDVGASTPQKRKHSVINNAEQSPDACALNEVELSPSKNAFNAEKNQLLTTVITNIERAFEKTTMLRAVGAVGTACTQAALDDSGNYSRNENCNGSSTSCTSTSDLTNADLNVSTNKVNEDQKSMSSCSIELNTEDSSPELICVRLCSLLKDQLHKSINEIREKYYQDEPLYFDMDIENDDFNVSNPTKTLINTLIDTDELEVKENTNVELPAEIDGDEIKALDTEDSSATMVNKPVEISSTLTALLPCTEYFQLASSAPKTHKFHLTIFQPNNPQQYYKAVQREHRMLRSALPPGVWVRVFEDRMDLLSVMMEGPKLTPYEDGLFLFDLQLSRDYPASPPLCHYISYCSDRLNPNLYEDGKVCVSLLGTWSGRGTEVWCANSTLLQLIVSIQGLILVPEPYFNEAGYEKQKGTQQGKENSRMYNEMAIIKMVQATTKLLEHPPEIFHTEILEYYQLHGMCMYERVKGWMELSKLHEKSNTTEEKSNCDWSLPEFPLIPASRGFCLTLEGLLDKFKAKLCTIRDNCEIDKSDLQTEPVTSLEAK